VQSNGGANEDDMTASTGGGYPGLKTFFVGLETARRLSQIPRNKHILCITGGK
jgi:hypothetical protein